MFPQEALLHACKQKSDRMNIKEDVTVEQEGDDDEMSWWWGDVRKNVDNINIEVPSNRVLMIVDVMMKWG